MKTILLLDKLRTKSTFRVQDIVRITGHDRNYARLILYKLNNKRYIKRITKNVYTMKDNIFLIASNLTYPSYISFWSASYFLGYTEQIVNTIQIATRMKKKLINFENYKIRFIPMRNFFGYKKLTTNEGDIFIVENEKLVIDLFLRPRESGNFIEIIKIFKNAKFSERKIMDYLKKVGKQTIIKRVGFLIEKYKGIDLSSSFDLDRNYIYLNPFSNEAKNVDKKWRVKY
ncbi:MAG: type IV toxin-antitoxin system AbiEi family antitoxin domain-containing protein [Candidatus Helarchaeota archaeon]